MARCFLLVLSWGSQVFLPLLSGVARWCHLVTMLGNNAGVTYPRVRRWWRLDTNLGQARCCHPREAGRCPLQSLQLLAASDAPLCPDAQGVRWQVASVAVQACLLSAGKVFLLKEVMHDYDATARLLGKNIVLRPGGRAACSFRV